MGALSDIRFSCRAELDWRWDVRSRIFVPPWHVTTGEQVCFGAHGAQRAAPRLLRAFPNETEWCAPNPDQIAGGNTAMRCPPKSLFLFRVVHRGLVHNYAAGKDAGTRLVLIE